MITDANYEDITPQPTAQPIQPSAQDFVMAVEQEKLAISKLQVLIEGFQATTNDAELQVIFKDAIKNFIKV